MKKGFLLFLLCVAWCWAGHAHADLMEDMEKEQAALKAKTVNLYGGAFITTNLWFEKPNALWCVQYKVGVLIPAGTEFKNILVRPAGFEGPTASREGVTDIIEFARASDGTKFKLHFIKPLHGGMEATEYAKRLFSEKPFAIDSSYSPDEATAIRSGVLVAGMSKEAVIRAYGYPPESLTPDRSANRWIYHYNKFKTKNVCFDGDSKTVKCAESL